MIFLSGMSAISECFQHLKEQQSKALIPFITAGDPDLETTLTALQALDQNGADLIELGIPYSDPLADGPVIQAAATRALQKGVTLTQILSGLKTLSLKAPLILFTYYNPMVQMGIRRFLKDLKEAGGSGLVVPDLPVEEADPVLTYARELDLDLILLVAPTSRRARMELITQRASGFVYLVSVRGVTGIRGEIDQQVQHLIQDLKQLTSLPIGVGFGISQPEQARQVVSWGADAAIVGSAFVQRLSQAETPESGIQAITTFCRDLKSALYLK
jgi:tryptophan synthase alpha chain